MDSKIDRAHTRELLFELAARMQRTQNSTNGRELGRLAERHAVMTDPLLRFATTRDIITDLLRRGDTPEDLRDLLQGALTNLDEGVLAYQTVT